jgi:protein-tyrosine phosphatase
MRDFLPNKKVNSAGVAALVGKSCTPQAANSAATHDLDTENHCAQQLTVEMCREYDLILVMEQHHADTIHQMSPEARGKVLLFGKWLDEKEVPDPYKRSDEFYALTFDLLKKAAQEWARVLK